MMLRPSPPHCVLGGAGGAGGVGVGVGAGTGAGDPQLPAARSGPTPALPAPQQTVKTGDQATDALLAELGI
jgi:hypothetical protein